MARRRWATRTARARTARTTTTHRLCWTTASKAGAHCWVGVLRPRRWLQRRPRTETREKCYRFIHCTLNRRTPPFTRTNTFSQRRDNFILPLTGRWDTFKRFMHNYELVCLKSASENNTRLVVVLFESDKEEENGIYDELSEQTVKQSVLIQNMIEYLRAKYPAKTRDEKSLLLVKSDVKKFSRSIGCELGAAQFDPHELLFFVDVDIHFSGEFLLRARLNTIQIQTGLLSDRVQRIRSGRVVGSD